VVRIARAAVEAKVEGWLKKQKLMFNINLYFKVM
jgi:hypothetical protein